MIVRQTNIVAHVIQFCRYLRSQGFIAGVNEENEVLEVFRHDLPHTIEQQRMMYKALLVKNRRQEIKFDTLYDNYWEELARAEDSKIKSDASEDGKSQKPAKPQKQNDIQRLKDWLYAGRLSDEMEVAAYSPFEAIGDRDFSSFAMDDQKELLSVLRLLAKRLANKLSRRQFQSKRPRHLDMRTTIRHSMNHGLDINSFHFKSKHIKKTNLILLCDVSKSMELYSQFLIEFMYGFHQVSFRINTFVFSTQLVALTKTLADHDFNKVLHALADEVPYWSGGTRIGASLMQFVNHYGRQLLNKNSIVMLLSDGWDTGEADVLEQAMRYLHKKSDRVIWLNPLAGNPDYEAKTTGMLTAMPYIDLFASAHNLESLKAIAGQLSTQLK